MGVELNSAVDFAVGCGRLAVPLFALLVSRRNRVAQAEELSNFSIGPA
jgi:hypothetical protein